MDRTRDLAQGLSRIENKISPTGVKRAVINCGTSGDNELVAAVTGKKIKVLGVVLFPAGDVSIRFESGAGGTALTGVMPLNGASGMKDRLILTPVAPGLHYFETASGGSLNLELSGAVDVDGFLLYVVE